MGAIGGIDGRDAARFVALSAGGWLLDAAILLTLLDAGVAAPFGANLASASAAATLVYLVAHDRIHRGRANAVGLRVGLYLGYTALLILAASAIMASLTMIMGRWLDQPPAGLLPAFVAKCLVTPPQLAANLLTSHALARLPLGCAR